MEELEIKILNLENEKLTAEIKKLSMEQKKLETEEKKMQTEIDFIELKKIPSSLQIKYKMSRMLANSVWRRITFIYTVDHANDLKRRDFFVYYFYIVLHIHKLPII